VKLPDEPTAMHYAALLWERRLTLVLYTLTIVAIVAVIVFLLPPTFEATTTLMPSMGTQKTSLLSQFGVNLEDFGLGASSSGWASPLAYIEFVKSRHVLGELLSMGFSDRPGAAARPLADIIEPKTQGLRQTELALRALRRDISASLDRRSGMLMVRVRNRSPFLAASIANSLDSLLVEFTVKATASQAGQNRRFIDARLADTERELSEAEERLSQFHEQNVRYGNSPRLSTEEARLTRTLRGAEEVYLTLRRQHELARIEEQRDTPTLFIIDSATEPIFKSAPKRLLSVFFAGILGLLVSSAWVIARASFAAMPPLRLAAHEPPESRGAVHHG
jgi:uncharacterized protein involved in exopolysaccharide biosynthesis